MAMVDKPVDISVFAPEEDDNAGISGTGWFVDMEVDFNNTPLADTGFNGLPAHRPGRSQQHPAGTRPVRGRQGRQDARPGRPDEHHLETLPGFSGPGTNLAGLFNITGVTNRTPEETELWDTWLVGAPVAGSNVDTTLTVAEVADLDHDGKYDDAPSLVQDMNGDGRVDAKDLKILGVASNIVKIPFHISGDPA